YAHALCTTVERRETGSTTPLREALATFHTFVAKEEAGGFVHADLYPLKQRAAMSRPQYEFPLRASTEPTYEIEVQGTRARIGTISLSQLLREAYPGAGYLHMAQRYRVISVSPRSRRVLVARQRYAATTAVVQTRVFPRLHGLHRTWLGTGSLVVEADLQVHSRVVGFRQHTAHGVEAHTYEPGSPYAQQPIERFFSTTGLCFVAPDAPGASSDLEDAVGAILDRGCQMLGLHRQDVALGRMYSRDSMLGFPAPTHGVSIYDDTEGSLRLTSDIGDAVPSILDDLLSVVTGPTPLEPRTVAVLEYLRDQLGRTVPIAGDSAPIDHGAVVDGLFRLVLPGQGAFRVVDGESTSVQVRDVRYTPNGMMYVLVPTDLRVTHMAPIVQIQPIHGATELGWYDPCACEWREVPHDA
ncbi:MAG: hypothetical protein KDA28_06070, partial [Phycisphaerales bacterium]|nr:hypothetical protein [Phycisphaerales bacterium]